MRHKLPNFAKLMITWLAATRMPPTLWQPVASHREYRKHRSLHRKGIERQRRVERGLFSGHTPFEVAGTCHVCSAHVRFRVAFEHSYHVDGVLTPNWREWLKCPSCGLNNRMRAVVHLLESRSLGLSDGVAYITEQTTPLYQLLSKRRGGRLVGSEYAGDAFPLGETGPRGIRNEDVSNLSFGSGQLGAVLSFDVLEHVPDYTRALSEFHRCLAAGGRLVLSVPFLGDSPENLIRARVDQHGKIVHLLPPEYHDDPMRSDGCLAFYHFGWELLDDLRDVGFIRVRALYYWSLEYGYLGADQMFIVAEKPV